MPVAGHAKFGRKTASTVVHRICTEDRREQETPAPAPRSCLEGAFVWCWCLVLVGMDGRGHGYIIHIPTTPHHTQLAVGVTGTFWVLGGPAVYGEGDEGVVSS